MGRLVASLAVIVALACCAGCGLGPRHFRKITHPAPLVRARALSLGYRKPDARVLPALVGRLDDSDPVVRLAAHEELRRRSRRDFGYLPWGSPEERARAIGRWRAWLTGQPLAPASFGPQPGKSLPGPTPQSP